MADVDKSATTYEEAFNATALAYLKTAENVAKCNLRLENARNLQAEQKAEWSKNSK